MCILFIYIYNVKTVNQVTLHACVRNWELEDYGALQHFIQLAQTSSTNLLPYSSVKVEIVLTEMKVRTESEILCCWIVDGWRGTAHCTLLSVAYKPYLFYCCCCCFFSWSVIVFISA